MRRFLLLGLLAVLAGPVTAQTVPTSATFGDLAARAIGPAVMSGRVTTLDAVPSDPCTLYVGTGGGGVWKSENCGTSFISVFDEQPQSIGALTIDPKHPDTVWVGTGEVWTRNSVSYGRGLYRTTDGGDSWSVIGFEDSERIAGIVIDPSDSDVVYVAVLGHLWDAHETRGIYKTTDGGETWARILYVDENTGAADLVMDPQETGTLYAAMWDFRRQPWSFRSGGPGSGLFKTTNGGETWTELRDDLPQGELGRIAIAVAPSRSNRLYAAIESDSTALYRSDDAGANWTMVDDSAPITQRPFYFMEMEVDPVDYDRVYKPGLSLAISEDGGDTFAVGSAAGTVHSDHHAIWIHPHDPSFIYLGTDGGVYRSFDRASSWEHLKNLPLSQAYHISYDMARPYRVYTGLQDNGSWRGPSQGLLGVRNGDWVRLGGGDGFHAYPDPADDAFAFAQMQGGVLWHKHVPTGQQATVHPQPLPGETRYRWNWNTALITSHHAPERVYTGAQYLFRSNDRGASWTRISPDLTTNDPEKQRQAESGGLSIDATGAENHTTIFAIAESPLNADVLWVGTDDGNVQVTRDGGATWALRNANAAGVPAHTWVSSISASHHAPGRAYATFDGHRWGDMAAYVMRTEDFGKTWTALADSTVEGHVHKVVEDPINPDVLFLGTEFGLYATVDGGAHWARMQKGIPPVSIRDLAIHPREHDLLIATHGRGLLIVDDISPLRALTPEVLDAEAVVLATRPHSVRTGSINFEFTGGQEFIGSNPDNAVMVAYHLKKRHLFGDLTVEVLDAEGNVLTALAGGKSKGINRIAWVPRRKAPKPAMPSGLKAGGLGVFSGPLLAPGTYTVRVTKGKEVVSGTVELVPDTLPPFSEADQAAQRLLLNEVYAMNERVNFLMSQIGAAYDHATARLDSTEHRRLERELAAFRDASETWWGKFVAPVGAYAVDVEPQLREHLLRLYNEVSSFSGRPTHTQQTLATHMANQLDALATEWTAWLADELPDLNMALERRGLEPIEVPDWETFQAWEGVPEAEN